MKPKLSSEQCAAFHMAGHTMMRYFCGGPMCEVSIKGTSGHVHPDKALEATLEDLFRQIDIAIAGDIAERMWKHTLNRRHRTTNSRKDFDFAVRSALRIMCLSGGQAEQLIHWRWIRVSVLFGNGRNWRMIKNLAGKLLAEKTITGQAVRCFLNSEKEM